MTFPTRPHAIFGTLQGTQSLDTKPTLQRAKNANAWPYTPADECLLSFVRHFNKISLLNTKAHPQLKAEQPSNIIVKSAKAD